jgi:hypothetical protein
MNDQPSSQFKNCKEDCSTILSAQLWTYLEHIFKSVRMISLESAVMQHKWFIHALTGMTDVHNKYIFWSKLHFSLTCGWVRRNTPQHKVMFPEVNYYKSYLCTEFCCEEWWLSLWSLYCTQTLLFFRLGQ